MYRRSTVDNAARRPALDRRTVLRGAAVAGVAGVAAAAGTALGATPAAADPKLPYPDVADTSHATEKAAKIMRGFFTAKSEHDPDKLMTFFSKDNAFYIDASSPPGHRPTRTVRRTSTR